MNPVMKVFTKTRDKGKDPKLQNKGCEVKPRISRRLNPALGPVSAYEIWDKQVVYRDGLTDSYIILGKLAKVIDTSSEKDDVKAAQMVEAQLNRLRGEMREPNLVAIQLTTMFYMSVQYGPSYAIYLPKKQ
jgi:hypothetical protein